MMRLKSKKGFSLVELMIVVLIILVISALAMPNVIRGIGSLRLRGAGSNVSGIMQRGRIQAVRTNRIQMIRAINQQGANLLFIDGPPYNSTVEATEGVVQISDSVVMQTDETAVPVSNFVTNSATLLGEAVTAPSTGAMAFNQRGLPCTPVLSGGVPSTCNASQAYVYFYQSTGAFGGQWIAISVTKAGRIRIWSWDGSTWS